MPKTAMPDARKHQGEPYAYCETIAAYKWHIRRLDERGLMPSGIWPQDAKTLCGGEAAWDIDVRMDPLHKTACRRCRDEYRKREVR